ncbi:2'-5' RNA ligase family protein [Nocardioides sp. P5_C9_2]
MYLSAVIVPPLAQREEVARLLADVGARMDGTAAAAPRRRAWSRSRREPSTATARGLTPLPVTGMTVHLTRFGFVEPEAASRLRATLEHDAAGWVPPTVHITGEPHMGGQDELLHLSLAGEVDGLRALFREITESARRAGFMLDRRSFAPLVPVSTLDEAVSDEALAALVAGLEDFAGTPWEIGAITLARLGFGASDELQEVATIPLGGSTAG